MVTGSTKGIGRALAEEFIRSGDNVVVTSRDEERVAKTVEELTNLAQTMNAAPSVIGVPVDVCKAEELTTLSKVAIEALGSVDIWINNAGTNAYAFRPLIEQTENDINMIVQTNVLGVLLSCREAINVMKSQEKGGHVFNMDGAGADGGATPRFAAYGATKRSLEQLGKSLRAELQLCGISNVRIHNLSPGMVTTDLLMAGADSKVSKWFINCLAEKPESVAKFLVPRIRDVAAMDMNGPIGKIRGAVGMGEYIRFLTKSRAYRQILERVILGKRKDRFVSED